MSPIYNTEEWKIYADAEFFLSIFVCTSGSFQFRLEIISKRQMTGLTMTMVGQYWLADQQIADFNDPQRLSPMKKENVKRSPSSYELHDTDFA